MHCQNHCATVGCILYGTESGCRFNHAACGEMFYQKDEAPQAALPRRRITQACAMRQRGRLQAYRKNWVQTNMAAVARAANEMAAIAQATQKPPNVLFILTPR